MRRGRRSSAPAAATSERLTSGTPRRAPRTATMRSQARAISKPPARANPSIAAISGLRAARRVMPANPRSPTYGRSPATNALRSMPALKPRPVPANTPTVSPSSASSASSAAATPSASARLTALRASGRLSVMSRTPSRRSVRTGSSGMRATLPASPPPSGLHAGPAPSPARPAVGPLRDRPRPSRLHAGLREVDLVLELACRLGAQPSLGAQAQDGLALGLQGQRAQLAVGGRGVLGLDVLLVELGGGALGVLAVDGAQALDRRAGHAVLGRGAIEALERRLRRRQAGALLLLLGLGAAVQPGDPDEERQREPLHEDRGHDGHERDQDHQLAPGQRPARLGQRGDGERRGQRDGAAHAAPADDELLAER